MLGFIFDPTVCGPATRIPNKTVCGRWKGWIYRVPASWNLILFLTVSDPNVPVTGVWLVFPDEYRITWILLDDTGWQLHHVFGYHADVACIDRKSFSWFVDLSAQLYILVKSCG